MAWPSRGWRLRGGSSLVGTRLRAPWVWHVPPNTRACTWDLAGSSVSEFAGRKVGEGLGKEAQDLDLGSSCHSLAQRTWWVLTFLSFGLSTGTWSLCLGCCREGGARGQEPEARLQLIYVPCPCCAHRVPCARGLCMRRAGAGLGRRGGPRHGSPSFLPAPTQAEPSGRLRPGPQRGPPPVFLPSRTRLLLMSHRYRASFL